MSNLVREKLEDYFCSMNPTSKRLMADINTFQQENSSDWKNLTSEEKSEVLWHCIVKSDIQKKYENVPKEDLGVEFFPVLKTRPGVKIIVDEGCSWRDEHSAPFLWKTQSQLDLQLGSRVIDDEKVKIEKSKSSSHIDEECKKDAEQDKKLKKDDEIKRSNLSIKRPDVPPPPIPPQIAQIPQFVPAAPVSAPAVSECPPTLKDKDQPIYAKVVKRKCGSSKTLSISELKAQRKAKEEAKPEVPPRMSLELRKDINITKYKTLPIDFDDIPKTGFDFLDNW